MKNKKRLLMAFLAFMPIASYADYIVYAKGNKLAIPEEKISGALLLGTNTGVLRMLNPEDKEILKEVSVGQGSVKDIHYLDGKIYLLVDNLLKVYSKSGEFIEEKSFANIGSTQSIEIGSDGNVYSAGAYVQSINYTSGVLNYSYSSSSTLGDVELTSSKIYSVDGKYRLRIMDYNGNVLDMKTYGTNQNPYGVGANESGVFGVNVSGGTRIYNSDGSLRCSGGLSGGTRATKIELDEEYAYTVKANTGHSNHGVYKLRLSDCSLVWDYNKQEGASGGTAVTYDAQGNGYFADGLDVFKVNNLNEEEWLYNSSGSVMSMEYMD